MCNKNSSDDLIKIEKRIHKLKWCELILTGVLLLAIFGSLMFVVKIQICNKYIDYQEAATVLNTYTSIVLGFVAMTVSLIGMVLGFHNTIQTENSNLETTKEFSKLSNSIERLNELEGRLEENLNKVSDKTIDLEKKMEQLGQFKSQLATIQNNLELISKDMRSSVDYSKGSDTKGIVNLDSNVTNVGNIETDE